MVQNMKQAFSLQEQAHHEPKPLAWAGMNQAVGLGLI